MKNFINRISNLLFMLFFVLSLSSSVFSEVRLARLFDDHMVLQCDQPVRVWGWASPAEKVKVQFADQSHETQANTKGRWEVFLEAMKPNFKGQELVVSGQNNQVKLKDVLLGEVWLCGGQSNMAWSLRGSRDADIEIASANYPAIRFFKIPNIARDNPQEDILPVPMGDTEGRWMMAVSDQVESCTAVGYYFGKRLHRYLRVPVGLINASWGGTMAQHWVSEKTLKPIPEMQEYIEKHEQAVKEWNAGGGEEGAKKRYQQALKEWEAQREKAKKESKREPRRPNIRSFESPGYKRQPGGMYNGMILPIAKATIKGVIFYQGENNSFGTSWKPFPKTFPSVISDWRKVFESPKLPFGILQIAGWSNRRSMTYDQNHHTNVVREVQFLTWKNTPGTGLIVTFDTNSNGSIHPGRKQPVGERTARWALAEVYNVGKNLEWKGPVYKSMQVEKEKIIISFEEESARGLRLDKDTDVGFYIAGKDKIFHHARARVFNRNQLQVWSDAVKEPVAVRYAISNLPMYSLMNGRELPAYPFRTDTWPIEPHQSTGTYEVEKYNWNN